MRSWLVLALSLLGASGLWAQTMHYDMVDWVAARLVYPPAAYEIGFEASIPVTFTVAADGTISDVECRASLAGESAMVRQMVDEAVRVVASAPRWLPATAENQPENPPAAEIEPAAEAVPATPEEYTLMVEFAMPCFGGEVAVQPSFMRSEGVELNPDIASTLRLQGWIAERLPLPDDFEINFTGVVERGGSLGNLRVIRTSDEGAAAAIFNLLTQAPRWSPGMGLTGQPVRVFRSFAMSFDRDRPIRHLSLDSTFGQEGIPPRDSLRETGDIYSDVARELGFVPPSFSRDGTIDDFREWVHSRVVYPESLRLRGVQGVVLVQFVVDTDGRVGDITELHSPNPTLARTVISVVKSSPRWTPGLYPDGNPMPVLYTMPVIFQKPR